MWSQCSQFAVALHRTVSDPTWKDQTLQLVLHIYLEAVPQVGSISVFPYIFKSTDSWDFGNGNDDSVIVDYRSRWIILKLPKDQHISSFPSQHEHLPDPYISGQQPKVLSKACSLYCCHVKVRMKASYSLGRTYSTMIETPLSWQLAHLQEAAMAQHQQESTPLKRTDTLLGAVHAI